MASNFLDKTRRRDRLAERMIRATGLFVIMAVIAILLLITKVALPLFYSPSATRLSELPGELLASVADKLPLTVTRESADSGTVTARVEQLDVIRVERRKLEKDFLVDEKEIKADFTLTDKLPGALSALAMDRKGATLYAGTANGWLLRWDVSGEQGRLLEQVQAFTDNRRISALALVFGDISLAVGDSTGGLSSWMPVAAPGSGEDKRLTRIHTLHPHKRAVIAIVTSPRDKSLASLDESGVIQVSHMTSERLLLQLSAPGAGALAYGPKGDQLAALMPNGANSAWQLDIPHPEISFSTLFGRVWYEGYDKPEFVWQSSAANDDFEAKLSLVPLIFGTIKATLCAMLFAVPLALLGALYTSQFMHPALKGRIKPAVEIMAAVPSVVVGFLAGLWLAPLLDTAILGSFVALLLVPLSLLLAGFAWRPLAERTRLGRRLKGLEFLLMLPVIALAVWLAFSLAAPLEVAYFGGDAKQWLFSALGVRYDQRNSIVIAIALGFAVVPIIFTIAEDALSNVPRNLTAASLALGASRWQTAWRVVLPSAMPGIFSAIMIGFGRAVGETMIVLMATGNTPIMSWSLFNGLRSLSANIAVEIPEAPFGGTLYRLLFLSAVLLFVFTFIINTVAELLRQRFRKKYGRY